MTHSCKAGRRRHRAHLLLLRIRPCRLRMRWSPLIPREGRTLTSVQSASASSSFFTVEEAEKLLRRLTAEFPLPALNRWLLLFVGQDSAVATRHQAGSRITTRRGKRSPQSVRWHGTVLRLPGAWPSASQYGVSSVPLGDGRPDIGSPSLGEGKWPLCRSGQGR